MTAATPVALVASVIAVGATTPPVSADYGAKIAKR